MKTEYLLSLCCTIFVVLMSSFYSTITVFAQNNEVSSPDPVSSDTKFNFVRGVSSQTENSNSSQIFQPEGIIVDSDDNLYVNDIQSNEIKKYDINGKFYFEMGESSCKWNSIKSSS